jgi:hypothetical protein
MLIVLLSIILFYRYYITNKKTKKETAFEIINYNLKQNVSKMYKEQILYRKNIIEHKHNYNNVLEDINKNNHYLLWFNNIEIDKTNRFDSIVYILDINNKNISLNYMNKYCNKMKINLYIISESHPDEFIDKVLINNDDLRFNISNYLSPYNFKYTFFGYLEKSNTYSDKKLNISTEDILNYIKKQGNTNYLLLTNTEC